MAPEERTGASCCWAPRLARPAPCCRCARARRASPLACLAVCALVLAYTLLGGFLFLALEGTTPSDDTAVAASKPNLSHAQDGELRSSTVERLWSITEDLNILYKENWTKLAARELMDFQRALVESLRGGAGAAREARASPPREARWTFAASFLYALTLITTIGHGNMVPRSVAGKMAALAYAGAGIPLVMLYLSTLGAALARAAARLYSRLRPAPPPSRRQFSDCDLKDKPDRLKRTPFQAALNLDSLSGGPRWEGCNHVRVPALLSALVIVAYVALGTFVFHTTERWSLIDGCYFSFASLATIGFGELRPGLYASTISARAEDIAIGVCCVYILVGIVVIAMCFNLIQEEMSGAVRGLGALCGTGTARARAVHSVERSRDDKLALAVLS